MREKSSISIRNATIAGVLTSVIVAFVPALRHLAITAFSQLYLLVLQAWRWIVEWHALPGAAWIALFALSAIGITAIAVQVIRTMATPVYYKYTEDNMHGLLWRWGWGSRGIKNLWCFCPRCDATLVYDDSSCRDYLKPRQETHFICENCSHKLVSTIGGGNRYYVTDMIEREILRRVRTGEFTRSP